MTIKLDNDTIGVWFLRVAHDQDFTGALAPVESGLELTYRFRYYRGDQSKQFEESEDVLNFYKVTMPGHDRDQGIAKVREILNMLLEKRGHPELGPIYEVINDGDMDAFITEFMQQDWTRAKWEPHVV